MVQTDPVPMPQPHQRRRRSDRYLEQAEVRQPATPVQQPTPVQQAEVRQPAAVRQPNAATQPPAQPTPAQPVQPSSLPRQPAATPTPRTAPRPTGAHRQAPAANSARQQPQRPTASTPVQPIPRQQPQRATNMAAPQPMPSVGGAQRQTPAQMQASTRQQPYQPATVPLTGMQSTRQQPYQPSGMTAQPYQQPNMAAPQPMPQPMQPPYQQLSMFEQPYQQPAMPAQPPMQRLPMNGQPAPYPQQTGYGNAPQQPYYPQQQPYYGPQGYAPDMMAAPEQRPEEPSQIVDPIDRPGRRSFFGGFGGPPSRRVWIIAVAAVVALALVIGGFFGIRAAVRENSIRAYVSAYDTKFCEGVYVDGIHLGGMTQQQGIDAVNAQAQRRNDEWYVRLTYQGQTVVEMNAAQLGMKVDTYDVLREAWAQGHASNDVHERQAAMLRLQEEPYEAYTAVPSGDTSVVDSVLADLRNQVYRAPQDAVLLEFDPARTYPFIIQDEVAGRMLNTDSLKDEIYRKVAVMESGELEIHPEPIQPSVTAEDIRLTVALRADEYTDIHTSSTQNRNENIKRAMALITGTVLRPGETFSFNGVVGRRTIENGFYTAPEYQYNREVEGIGGGVCQVSTTMYLAAVAANLEITKHTPHSMAVRYTTFGKDATVNMDGKQIDFAFRNNTDGNIYICASVQYDRSISKYNIARVRIYGPSLGEGVTYKLEAEEIELLPQPEDEIRKDTKGEYVTYTDEQKVVSEGREGHVTQSYRVKYVNGVAVERTPLFKDTYKAAPRVIYVGVEERWIY